MRFRGNGGRVLNTTGRSSKDWLRLLPLCLVAALAIMVAACGSDDDGGGGSASASADCTPRHEFETLKSGVLTAVFTAYPPYGFVENGTAKGIDGEILAEIAKMECLELKASDADPAGIPSMIQSERADVSGGDWWRNKDRADIVAMTDPIYLDGFGVLSKEGIDTVDELMGKTIGDLQGNYWNKECKEVFGDDYKLYRQQTQVLQDLKSGRIDVAFSTPGSAVYYRDKAGLQDYQVKILQPDDRLSGSVISPQAAIMHALEHPDLTKALNEDLAELRKSGKLEEIVTKHGLPASVLDTGPPSQF